MKNYLPILILSFFFLSIENIYAQMDSTDIDEVIENIIEDTDLETSSDILELIEDIQKNPVDLNKCTEDDLMRIPYMTLTAASSIIKHRNQFGSFFSVNELKSVQGIDLDLYNKISQFLIIKQTTIEKPKDIEYSSKSNFYNDIKFQLRSRIKTSLQPNKAFLENKYPGNKLNSYTRFLLDYKDYLSVSLLAEKDPGEKSYTDFSSVSVAFKNIDGFETIIVGDYIVEFGQGLAIWSPYSFSKGADIIGPLQKRDRNIVQFKSTEENKFLRGFAASYKINPFRLSFFYSNNYFDASIDTIVDGIISTPVDGYHRTENELSKKNSSKEQIIGSRIDFYFNSLKLQLLFYNSTFSRPFLEKTKFDPVGKSFNFFSSSYNYRFSNFNILGEFAYNGKAIASINSLQIGLSDKLTFITSIRNYPANYIPLHSFGFGESSGNTQNEFGVYSGFIWKTFLGKINFYYDSFSFPESNQTYTFPGKGNEYYIHLESRPYKNIETFIRYKIELKDINTTFSEQKIVAIRNRQSTRFEFTVNVSSAIKLKSRFEFNDVSIDETNQYEKGYLYLQDIKIAIAKNLSCYARAIFFKTDSYNSAVYEFESDLTGVMTNLPMNGEGLRWYLLVKYKLFNSLNISAKYSETVKPKQKSIGSGTSEIFTNIDNKLNLQFEYNF